MDWDSLIKKAGKAAGNALREAEKGAEKLKEEAVRFSESETAGKMMKTAEKTGRKAWKLASEAADRTSEAASSFYESDTGKMMREHFSAAAEAVLDAASEVSGVSREKMDQNLKTAADRMSEKTAAAKSALKTAGENAGKTMSGMKEAHYRKIAEQMHLEAVALAAETAESDRKNRLQLKERLEALGSSRLSALSELSDLLKEFTLISAEKGRALSGFDELQKAAEEKLQLLQTAASSGSAASAALAGTPVKIAGEETVSEEEAETAALAWLSGEALTSESLAFGGAVLSLGSGEALSDIVSEAGMEAGKFSDAEKELNEVRRLAEENVRAGKVLKALSLRADELRTASEQLCVAVREECGWLKESAEENPDELRFIRHLISAVSEISSVPLLDRESVFPEQTEVLFRTRKTEITGLLNDAAAALEDGEEEELSDALYTLLAIVRTMPIEEAAA